jgi:hypothetical protein
MDVLNNKKGKPNKGYLKQPTTYSQPQTHITVQANLFPSSTIAIPYQCWHVMVAIQLSQMLLAKSTTRFKLQAYLGRDIIIDYMNQAFSVLQPISDRKQASLYRECAMR